MPDGKFAIYEFHNSREQALYAAGARQAEEDQTGDADRAAWLLFQQGLDMVRDAIGDVESRHPDALTASEHGSLEDLESTIRGAIGDAIEIEAEAPGAMRHARLLLADARSEVGGTE